MTMQDVFNARRPLINYPVLNIDSGYFRTTEATAKLLQSYCSPIRLDVLYG